MAGMISGLPAAAMTVAALFGLLGVDGDDNEGQAKVGAQEGGLLAELQKGFPSGDGADQPTYPQGDAPSGIGETEGPQAAGLGESLPWAGCEINLHVWTCDTPDPPVEQPTRQPVTPGLMQTAFERIPLPPSELIIQPPDGKTLVNFDTNFYTENDTFRRSVTLLGQNIDLDITPAAFTWHHGDGTQQTTTEPGAPYPDLQVTHNYARKGTVSPSVDTTYSAVFRVNGGPWRPVPGVVTIEGEPQELEVVTATPRLVGY